ncbi:hypothetical protein J6590_008505 [Homalodisca vitripennis]|nr:hypothetical protein J6590_008505 [Homalodisca vitripennis]
MHRTLHFTITCVSVWLGRLQQCPRFAPLRSCWLQALEPYFHFRTVKNRLPVPDCTRQWHRYRLAQLKTPTNRTQGMPKKRYIPFIDFRLPKRDLESDKCGWHRHPSRHKINELTGSTSPSNEGFSSTENASALLPLAGHGQDRSARFGLLRQTSVQPSNWTGCHWKPMSSSLHSVSGFSSLI